MPWLEGIAAAKVSRRLPAVLTLPEVDALLAHVHGTSGLILRLSLWHRHAHHGMLALTGEGRQGIRRHPFFGVNEVTKAELGKR